RPLRGLVVPASPPPRGPGKAGAHRARQKQRARELAMLCFALVVASARWERAALSGPLWRGGRVEESPQDGCRARHRGGLSFGYFSLATQRKVTRAPTGARKHFVLQGVCERGSRLKS